MSDNRPRHPFRGAPAAPRRLWPDVDHYEALEPAEGQEHPVDLILSRDPRIERTYRKVLRLHKRISVAKKSKADFREYADARLLLASLEARLAFNVGVDLGLVAGRQDAWGRRRRRPGAHALRRSAAVLLDPSVPAGKRLLSLIDMAWALAAGPATPRPRARAR